MLDRVQPSKPHGGATTIEARREYEINAKAIRHFAVLHAMLVDMYGRPQGEVVALGGGHLDAERRSHWTGPRLSEFTGLSQYGWACRGNGATGRDAIDLVAYLGSCDREKAADWLQSTLSRIVEIAA